MEIGPDIRAAPAASLAGKSRLQIGQPKPSIATDRCPMGAMIVAAIDQQAANAASAYLCEGDFLAGCLLHDPMMPPIKRTVKPLASLTIRCSFPPFACSGGASCS
jgi:hypothetical protein